MVVVLWVLNGRWRAHSGQWASRPSCGCLVDWAHGHLSDWFRGLPTATAPSEQAMSSSP